MAMKLSQADEHLNRQGIVSSQQKLRGNAGRILSNKIILIAAGLGALSWILEASIHVFLLGEGTFSEEIFHPDLHHILIRSSIFIIFVLFGIYAQVTIAERKQAERELLARHEELAALYEISTVISRTIELEKLFSDILNAITRLEIFRVEPKGGIFTIEGDNMKLVSHLGHDKTFLDLHKDIRVGDCLCGLAAKTGEIIISGNCEADSRHTVTYEGMKPHGHIILPIKNKNTVSGVLYLYLPADINIDNDKIKLLKYIGTQIGIGIEKARLYEETKASSLHDPLTGLANRRLMDIVYEKSFALSKRLGMPFSVIMSDIDRFKQYNDRHGHAAGDRLLVDISKIITKEIRGMDLVVRYGGEEFFIMLPETGEDGACNLAERIRSTVENETDVTISLGIASFKEGMKRKDLIRKADEALYQAKQSGRNRVVVSR